MFGLKGRDTFNKPTSNVGITIKKAGQLWIRFFPVVLWIIVGYIIVMIGYTWHSYLHKRDVTEQEKDVYISKQIKEATFKKGQFDALKNTISKRQEYFDGQKNEYRDIFYEHELSQKDVIEQTQKNSQEEIESGEIQ